MCNGAAKDIDEFVAMLDGVKTEHPMVVVDLGPVVGTHTGPGTIGTLHRDRRLSVRRRGVPAGHGGSRTILAPWIRRPNPPSPRLPGSGMISDLPTRGADLVDSLVELLRDKTVRPLTLVTRAIVFGIIVFAAGVVTVSLLSITLIRLLTVYVFDGRVWLSDLVVGVLFVVGRRGGVEPAHRPERADPKVPR